MKNISLETKLNNEDSKELENLDSDSSMQESSNILKGEHKKIHFSRFYISIISISIAVLLGLMIFVIIPKKNDVNSMEVGYNHSKGNEYVSEIVFSSGKDSKEALNELRLAGYKPIFFDLHKWTGKKYAYLGYKTTPYKKNAIRGIIGFTEWALFSNKQLAIDQTVQVGNITKTITYFPTPSVSDDSIDLNVGCWGPYSYLYYTKDIAAGDPITQIIVSKSPLENPAVNVFNVKWQDGTPANMNRGFLFGSNIFILFKREESG